MANKLENHKPKSLVWDCGSTLYDSFELNSFKHHLDSAIASRSLSMPHLPDRRGPPPPLPPSVPTSKPSSKFSRSLSKLLRSLFRPKPNSTASIFRAQDQPKDGFYVFYEVGSLSTIPEVPEADFAPSFSPEIGSLVKKTASERFAAANSLGISCA
ncbi:uncharacterized protein LOC111008455 [Momordica charantia]|uniref:Uncharacterized protein LOC111008455 n=1 Tax=Momordica charantia TaxID=3673 RepID=A0A6J1C6M4_MOMCH|nr:uncharacterized protein LOC111008455 [Momordica charantia]